MADNLTTQSTTPATVPSASVIATDDVTGVHFQKVKLDVGGDGVSVPATGDGTNGLDVDVTRVQGTVTVGDGGSTLSVDDGGGSLTVDGTVGISGTVPVSGAFYQATQPVSLATAPTTPVTGTFWQATQPVSGTVAVTGVATETTLAALNTKVTAVDTGAVTITGALPGGGNTIGAISNAGFTASQGTASNLKAQVEIAASQTLSTVTNVEKFGGQVVTMGTGARDAGTQRVTIATNDVVPITPSTVNLVKGFLTSTTGPSGGGTLSNFTAPGAGISFYITSISVVNTGTASTLITFNEGVGPTPVYYTIAPALGGSNITFPVPLKITANSQFGYTQATSSSTVYVSATGFTGAG